MAFEPGGGSGGVPPVDAADLSAAASAVHVASLGAGTLAAFVIGAFVLLMTIRVAARLTR
jgi:hypothetical protein